MHDQLERSDRPRMGRISYLNVLPVYHALESGLIPHAYELVYGPPAVLNDLMAQGELAAASASSIEYARRPERYRLLPNLAIGSKGPVQSVQLFSSLPIEDLDGKSILVSAQTHTSAALLRLIMREMFKFSITWTIGDVMQMAATANPPEAFLAIGDDALRMRKHPGYPFSLDLGDAWMRWTGLPFIFGVWIADPRWLARHPAADNPSELLNRSRNWGMDHMDQILDIAERNYPNMTRTELESYFKGLSYQLGKPEMEGMLLFWDKLLAAGEIPRMPCPAFL